MDDTVKGIARPAATRTLREAVRKARVEEAYRLDDAADHHDSEVARLELLKAELESVFTELPANDDRFSLMLVPSRPARLWIDLFTYDAIDETSAHISSFATARTGAGPSIARIRSARWPTASPATWRGRSCAVSGRRQRC